MVKQISKPFDAGRWIGKLVLTPPFQVPPHTRVSYVRLQECDHFKLSPLSRSGNEPKCQNAKMPDRWMTDPIMCKGILTI